MPDAIFPYEKFARALEHIGFTAEDFPNPGEGYVGDRDRFHATIQFEQVAERYAPCPPLMILRFVRPRVPRRGHSTETVVKMRFALDRTTGTIENCLSVQGLIAGVWNTEHPPVAFRGLSLEQTIVETRNAVEELLLGETPEFMKHTVTNPKRTAGVHLRLVS